MGAGDSAAISLQIWGGGEACRARMLIGRDSGNQGGTQRGGQMFINSCVLGTLSGQQTLCWVLGTQG